EVGIVERGNGPGSVRAQLRLTEAGGRGTRWHLVLLCKSETGFRDESRGSPVSMSRFAACLAYPMQGARLEIALRELRGDHHETSGLSVTLSRPTLLGAECHRLKQSPQLSGVLVARIDWLV